CSTLCAFCNLDRHLQVDQARLQQRQRQLILGFDPVVTVTGVSAHIKVEMGQAPWHALWSKVNFIKQVICLRAWAVLTVEAGPPEFFADRAVVSFRPDAVCAPDGFNLIATLVCDSLSDEQFAPRRCGRWLGHVLAE